MLALCKNTLSSNAAQNVFVFTYDWLRRYRGAWHLDSEDENILLGELKKCRITAKRGNRLIPMDKEEERFLKILCGKGHHLQMSRGVICKGVPHITEGPLKGMESRICKIDRHKRLAQIMTTTRRDSGLLPAGLEIMEKVI